MSRPVFSVILCTYNRHDRLPEAISHLLRQDIGADAYDIWVMDNSPPSDARAKSRARFEAMQGGALKAPNLHYVELDRPGLANARNEGIERSEGEIVVFIDDDALAGPHWLSAYRDAFAKADKNVAAIGGRIAPYFEAQRPGWLHENLLSYLSVFDQDAAYEGYQPCGANVAFRRADIAGSFFRTGLGRSGDEKSNLLSGEESALTDFIKSSGKKFGYAPLAGVTHLIPASRLTRPWFRRRAAWQAISDQLQHPLGDEDAPKLWPYMIDYIKKLPREQIPFMGLFWDTDDPELFRQQLICTQLLTHIMISQGRYPPEMLEGA